MDQTKEGDKPMRTFSPFDSHNSLEALEPKLSPSSVGAVLAAPPVSTIQATDFADDDPLPDPEPPIPYPGDGPPIEYPLLPPLGPVGPG